MKLCISVPSGYHTREILLPLQTHLTQDSSITEVQVITPAAKFHAELFPNFATKYVLHENPTSLAEHVTLLKKLQPTVVVTPTVGLDAKDTLILRAGNMLSIPTVTFIASWDNVFKMERLRDKGHEYEMPQHFAVWNQMNLDHLIRAFGQEIDSQHVAITGPPRFDYFAHTDRIPSREQLLTYLGFSSTATDAPLIHCATTELYPFEYIIKSLRRAIEAKRVPAASLLYASVHPGGDMSKHEHYRQYNAQVKYSFGRRETSPHPDFLYVPSDEETYLLIALFKHTNVLVNQSSTVAIESMAADVPVINVKYGQPWDWLAWRRSAVYRDFQQHYQYITEGGATTIVHNNRELVTTLKRYLDHPELHRAERKETLKKIISFTDGGNSRRLIDFIKKCAA